LKGIENNKISNSSIPQWGIDLARNTSWVSFSYEAFTSEYEPCNQEDYQKLIDTFLKWSGYQVKNAYIELSKTKLHFVFDASFTERWENTSAPSIAFWVDSTSSLMKSEQLKVYTQIIHPEVTGSWIYLEQRWEDISWYVDIDMPKYNFDTNLTVDWTINELEIFGDYSYQSPSSEGSMNPAFGSILSWLEVSGNLTWSINDSESKFMMDNTLNIASSGISWMLNIESNTQYNNEKQSWYVKYSWQMQMGENASPINWEASMIWDMETNDSLLKGNFDYNLDIPNIASMSYGIWLDFTYSGTPDKTFESPTNIIPQKSLDTLMMINKRKVEKEKEEEILEKLKQLEQWKNEFTATQMQQVNSKISSDLRNLAAAIETNITQTNNPLSSYVDNSKSIETNNWTLLIWDINFKTLGQNWSDFRSFTWEPYEIRVFSLEVEDKTYAFYQISWQRIINNALERSEKWNYFKVNPDMPDSLFDIEVE